MKKERKCMAEEPTKEGAGVPGEKAEAGKQPGASKDTKASPRAASRAREPRRSKVRKEEPREEYDFNDEETLKTAEVLGLFFKEGRELTREDFKEQSEKLSKISVSIEGEDGKTEKRTVLDGIKDIARGTETLLNEQKMSEDLVKGFSTVDKALEQNPADTAAGKELRETLFEASEGEQLQEGIERLSQTKEFLGTLKPGEKIDQAAFEKFAQTAIKPDELGQQFIQTAASASKKVDEYVADTGGGRDGTPPPNLSPDEERRWRKRYDELHEEENHAVDNLRYWYKHKWLATGGLILGLLLLFYLGAMGNAARLLERSAERSRAAVQSI